jgi:hypothetical protein
MIEDILWECFTLGVASEDAGETEGLGDGEIGFNLGYKK